MKTSLRFNIFYAICTVLLILSNELPAQVVVTSNPKETAAFIYLRKLSDKMMININLLCENETGTNLVRIYHNRPNVMPSYLSDCAHCEEMKKINLSCFTRKQIKGDLKNFLDNQYAINFLRQEYDIEEAEAEKVISFYRDELKKK